MKPSPPVTQHPHAVPVRHRLLLAGREPQQRPLRSSGVPMSSQVSRIGNTATCPALSDHGLHQLDHRIGSPVGIMARIAGVDDVVAAVAREAERWASRETGQAGAVDGQHAVGHLHLVKGTAATVTAACLGDVVVDDAGEDKFVIWSVLSTTIGPARHARAAATAPRAVHSGSSSRR